MVPIDAEYQLLSTPQNCLHTAKILIAFPTAAARTEQQDNANRSIGQTYFIRTTRDGPYAAAGITPVITLSLLVRLAHNSQINSNKYGFF